eukprot:2993756-Pyramimonas_sp.AAC.1
MFEICSSHVGAVFASSVQNWNGRAVSTSVFGSEQQRIVLIMFYVPSIRFSAVLHLSQLISSKVGANVEMLAHPWEHLRRWIDMFLSLDAPVTLA